MHWMANHFDKRLDPRLLVPGARSVISLLYNYYTPGAQNDPHAPKLSKYAYGKDYHLVIKDKLYTLFNALELKFGSINGRVFVDSAPVLERTWAERSGLGWIGKNSMLISKGAGSYYFLAEIISDLNLEPDGPVRDYCGTCNACVEACPTEAILPDRTLDSGKCISYLTIELKNEIPADYRGKMENWVFGCDVCQEVCPWNRFSTPHKEPAFEASETLLNLSKADWHDMKEELYQKLFKHSAVKRTGFKGLKRNLVFLEQD